MNTFPWLAFVANYALQSALLVLAASIAGVLARNRSAATRNLIWRGALAAILLAPILMVFAPRVNFPASKSTAINLERALSAPSEPVLHSTLDKPADGPTLASIPDAPSSNLAFGAIVSAAYIVGCGFFVLRWLWGWSRILRIVNLSPQLENEGTSRTRVRVTDNPVLTAPLTFGTINPVILLPRNTGEWPEERLIAVMLHEKAHIQRRDWMLQFVADLLCVLQWFNPAIWALSSRLRGTAEESADDMTLQEGIVPSSYARELLSFVQIKGLQGVGMARRSNLDIRLRRVLAISVDRTTPNQKVARSLFATACVLGLVIAGIRFVRQANDSNGWTPLTPIWGSTVRTIASGGASDGMTARILYLSKRVGGKAERWRPDGAQATKADMTDEEIRNEGWRFDKEPKSIWMAIDIRGVTRPINTKFEGGFQAAKEWMTVQHSGDEALVFAKLKPDYANQITDGSIGISYGPWKMVEDGKMGFGALHAVASNWMSYQNGRFDSDTHRPVFTNVYDKARTAIRISVPRQFEGSDLQLRAFDAHGSEFLPFTLPNESQFDPSAENGRRDYGYEFGNPNSIVRVELWSRPWVRIPFKGIHFSPNIETGS